MTQSIDYSQLIQPTGSGYRQDQIVPHSHYNDPINQNLGRPAGNSRKWGDASADLQAQVIDILIDESRKAGLNDHQTAYVLAIARAESGFNPDAAAGTTSASGLGQFINGTGRAYGLGNDNRWDIRAQAEALIQHYQDNARLAQQREQGEEYIYKYHHDGPSKDFDGLSLANKIIIPYLNQLVGRNSDSVLRYFQSPTYGAIRLTPIAPYGLRLTALQTRTVCRKRLRLFRTTWLRVDAVNYGEWSVAA
jgi:hypothetical protein